MVWVRLTVLGGKLEPGESIEQAVAREVHEESGMKLLSYEKRGIISFEIEYAGNSHLEVHVFYSADFTGEITENDEMEVLCIPKNAIPYDEMWADDRFWLPVLLSGKYFLGTGIFDVDQKLLSFTLDRVEETNFLSTPIK